MTKQKTYAFRIARDFWDEDGVRHNKGEIMEMTADDAMEGVEAGKFERVKDD